jgi:pre-rRNA-processing protein TSR3
MNLLAILFQQDDPSKCTAAKLARFRLLTKVTHFRYDTLLLVPLAKTCLTRNDRDLSSNLCVIDCSWESAGGILQSHRWLSYPLARKLPALLAGNPINYAKLGKLSSVEALAGALLVLGYNDQAALILNKFKWGHTFYELNSYALAEYAKAQNEVQIRDIENKYFKRRA